MPTEIAPASGPARTGSPRGRWAAGCLAASGTLLLAVAAAGESAAVPGLGPVAAYPAWSFDLGPSSAVVASLLSVAYLVGAVGLWLGLRAVVGGARVRRRTAVAATLVVCVAVLCVPPVGSGDHLNYAAYGRIAAAGDDPYVERPTSWRDGTDPVASASQPPWAGTRSVYGPVATATQALTSVIGGDSLRLTVWAWQLVVVAAFAGVGAMLTRLASRASGAQSPTGAGRAADLDAAGTRVLLLWTLNPFVVGPAVLGAHVDVLAVALAVAGVALAGRYPLLAGAAVGAAAAVKLPYALAAIALCWGVRRLGRRGWGSLAQGVLGALAVWVPAHAWAGDHVYDQLERARSFVSLATPWRPLVDWLETDLPSEPVRAAVAGTALPLALVVMAIVVVLVRRVPLAAGDPVTESSTRALLVLVGGWVLVAPYALPWYDVGLWAPLALLAPSLVDRAVLARSLVLALAYVPGRVVGLSQQVEDVTLGFRTLVAPWLIGAVLLLLAWWAVRSVVADRAPVRAAG